MRFLTFFSYAICSMPVAAQEVSCEDLLALDGSITAFGASGYSEQLAASGRPFCEGQYLSEHSAVADSNFIVHWFSQSRSEQSSSLEEIEILHWMPREDAIVGAVNLDFPSEKYRLSLVELDEAPFSWDTTQLASNFALNFSTARLYGNILSDAGQQYFPVFRRAGTEPVELEIRYQDNARSIFAYQGVAETNEVHETTCRASESTPIYTWTGVSPSTDLILKMTDFEEPSNCVLLQVDGREHEQMPPIYFFSILYFSKL